MILELFLALLLGIVAGTLAGLLPGVHINLISVFLLSTSTFFLSFVEPIVLAVFIVAMTISDTFISFVPSIFLGAPNDESALSVLPGHKLLLKGKAQLAMWLTLTGLTLGIPIMLIFTLLFIFFLAYFYSYIQIIMPYILILASLFLIITEKSKLRAFVIFMLAGFLGIATLNLPLNEPLFPLLTGLFGTSTLIISITRNTKLKKQENIKFSNLKLTKKEIFNSAFASTISAPFCSFLPGLGSSQAAVIGSEVTGEITEREFLILLGAINLIVASLSFVTLYAINKTRTGTALAVKQILPSISTPSLLVILATILLASIFAFFLTIKITKIFSRNITKFNYQKISLIILIFLFVLSFLFSGFLGLLVLATSTFLGITAVLFNVRRTQLMASLLLPTILFYLL